jgi:hypothetical protein
MKINFKVQLLFTLATLLFNSCSNDNAKNFEVKSKDEVKAESNFAKKPESWIKERVAKAKKELNSSEGGKLVWQAMEAHGGLEKWFNNGPISFRFDYLPLGDGTARKTVQQIDTWSNKAVHQDVLDPEDTFGWDGENAWLHRNDTANFSFNIRFWALTPYYFLGQPFIFDGKGVIIEKLDDQMLKGIAHDAVRITFEAGTGDAPDDYYINLYDKETHELKALKYVVSYPAYFKNGVHSPEKTMVLNKLTTVDGIKLPTGYETFALSEVKGELGPKVTTIEVSKISFLPNLLVTHFEIPEGAELIKDL